MLRSLYVRNLALIDELSVEFTPGLTVITGETGAGKSILMGALALVLGDRTSSDMVRSGAKKAVVEAVFEGAIPKGIDSLLADAAIETGPELILRRELSASGQSRCFINDTPNTAALLKQVARLLVDLHGQHDHQQLLDAASHAPLLDGYSALTKNTELYQKELARLRELASQIGKLRMQEAAIGERRDYLEFQYRELDGAQLNAGEEKAIQEELCLLENSESIATLAGELSFSLYESERSAFSILSSAVHTLSRLSSIDRRYAPHLEELQAAASSVEELSRLLGSAASGLELNADRLEELRERLHSLQRLARKHAKSIDELIVLRNHLADEIAEGETFKETIALLEDEYAKQREVLSSIASELSEKRKKGAACLEKDIVAGLTKLGIPSCSFRVKCTREEDGEGEIELAGKHYRAFANGYDRIEFLISTNAGEAPRPLAKVASGGEISRVMLAMKTALAQSADLPILIFDEIDTGISGRIADAVGKNLQNLAKLHQIIAITHLPQIAAMGDTHLYVRKTEHEGRTCTEVTPLQGRRRIEAVASLISGSHLSDASLAHAAELIGKRAPEN